MKCLSLLLSMMVATVAVAQKPLDRGIHKRKTGGVSFLFGKKKDLADVPLSEEIATLETLAPTNVNVPLASARLVETPMAFATKTLAPFSARHARRSFRPLNRRGLSVLVLPSSKKRMLHRPFSKMNSPSDGEATYDWTSITGLTLGCWLCSSLIQAAS